MRHWTCYGLQVLMVAALFGVPNFASAAPPPSWAYPLVDPSVPPPVDDGKPLTTPDSKQSFRVTELLDQFHAVDWYPEEHPKMPVAVATGHQPDQRACGYCHLSDGQGRPENASLAGLSADYIIQQVEDYKSGERRSLRADASPHARMLATSKAISESELTQAAAYFAAIPFKQRFKVVEADTIPKSEIMTGSIWGKAEAGGTEELGHRIIEVTDERSSALLRDSHGQFTAYVPYGSIVRGLVLATTGGANKTLPCGSCHGVGLKGGGNAGPPLAGRSATYMVRQLMDMKAGTRAGANSGLMKPVVANLDDDDIIGLAAYAASLPPK